MENLKENDDDQELEIVELEQGKPIPPMPAEDDDTGAEAKPKPAVEDEDDDPEDDAADKRLATSQDETDDALDPAAAKRKKRQDRAQRQKDARERSEREIARLTGHSRELEERLARLEGGHMQTSAAQVETQLSAVQARIRQLEDIHSKAIEAGAGEDATAAMRLRDEAIAERNILFGQKNELETARTRPAAPQVDPNVTHLANQWRQQNPWYTQGGVDEDSMVTAAIDATILREGYNPATMEYWQELTRRVSARLGGGDADVDDTERQQPKRKVPPQGNTREHAPPSTRNQVYVTPERKQAMIDAGSWDDPARRKKQLAAYAAWDRENSAR